MKTYNGRAFICVVGPETDFGICRDSILGIQTQPGDSAPHYGRGTKGYEVRQRHINNFIESGYEFILMLDHDMIFPPDTLQRLRSHQRPYVSGYYLRRQYQPIAPVWFDPGRRFPLKPYTADPERGRLHKLGASGWGCALIHRDVVMAVRELLKGEWEVLEDDMDVWPYDLGRAMRAINCLAALRDAPNGQKETEHYAPFIDILQAEIRPLRGDADPGPIGSDIRFPWYARAAGYQLYGDPDVRCGHILYYPLNPDDYSGMSAESRQGLEDNLNGRLKEGRKFIKKRLKELEGKR